MIERLLNSMRRCIKSKTINYALLVALLGVLETNYRLIQNHIPEEYQGLVYILISAGIVVLRFKTTESIANK